MHADTLASARQLTNRAALQHSCEKLNQVYCYLLKQCSLFSQYSICDINKKVSETLFWGLVGFKHTDGAEVKLQYTQADSSLLTKVSKGLII